MANSNSNLHKLSKRGQSVWIDSLSRTMLESGDLAQLMKRRRYSFVTLEDALRDEAYGAADTYTGEESIDWLGRWAITKGIKTLGDVLDGIPDVPGFVTEAADDRAGPPARHRR